MENEQEVPAEAAENQAETPAEETTEPESTEETAETVADEEVPPAPKKKKETYQEGIDRLTRARREAERDAAHWREVALARQQPAPTPSPIQPPPSNFPARPTLDQFETTTAYEDALLDWRDTVKATQTRAVQQQAAQQTALKTFDQRAKTLRETHEDFDEVIEAPVFSPLMRHTLLNSENGPEIAYHLGLPQNREEADRIRALPVEMQPYELGKLETKLLLAKGTKKVPGAPSPIKPVGMTGGGTEKDPSKMTTAEWMAWDKEKTMKKLKQKYGGN